jgi:hypothetical protein
MELWNPKFHHHLRSEVLTAVVMKISVLRDSTSFSPLKANRRFGETCSIHLQDWRVRQARNQFSCPIFMLVSCFNHKDWDEMFVRILGWHSTDYTALYPRKKKNCLSTMMFTTAHRWSISGTIQVQSNSHTSLKPTLIVGLPCRICLRSKVASFFWNFS